jgi:hypothetical protein
MIAAAGLAIASADAREPGDYQVGDRAETDIVTPIQLTVVNAESTEALKQKEAQRVPVVLKFVTNSADRAVSLFRRRFEATRSNFVAAAVGEFHHRPLTSDDLAAEQFASFVSTFQKQNRLFPVDVNRAALWASGDPDSAYRDSLAATLRNALSSPIRPDTSDLKLGATVRLVAVTAETESLTVPEVEQRGVNLARTNLTALAAARRDLQNFFPNDERAAGRYLATFLRANCAVDEEVTSQLRARRTEGMWAADHFEPGQVIARAGQVIDARTKAVLDQLNEKMAFGQLRQLAANDQLKTIRDAKRDRWLAATSALLFLLFVLVIWRLLRRRAMPMLPATLEGGPWQQRALIAEQRAHEAHAMVRSGVMDQLAHWLSDKLVRKLISHRSHLLEVQKQAAVQMAELESRLEKIHAPLQSRLLAYERRIAELEKELAAKGEENRELIKAEIEIVRKQLELEREKTELEMK